MSLFDERLRILVLEDDLAFQKQVKGALLSLFQFSVTDTAQTATQAMTLMNDTKYDLVIIDYQLAGNANGLVFWNVSSKRFPQTTYMLMSGLPELELLGAMSGHQQAPSFLAKPFSKAELKRHLEKNLHKMKISA